MTIKSLLHNKSLGWSLYALIALIFVLVFAQFLITTEISSFGFNRADKYTKSYLIIIDVLSIDYNTNELSCQLEIPRDFRQSYPISYLIISSVTQTPSHANPDSVIAETCFTYPSANEIVDIIEKRGRGPEMLYGSKHNFRFRVPGNVSLYPYDLYSPHFEIVIGGPDDQVPNFEFQVREALPDLSIADFRYHSGVHKFSFSFQLVRSVFVRVFTVVVYGFALAFLLFIGLTKDIKDLSLQSLGYLLALWGLRDIISGRSGHFPTFVDYLTLALFSMLLLILTARYLKAYYDSLEG